MFIKKVLIASFSFVGILFIALVLTTNSNNNVLTKLVVVSDTRNAGYIDNNIKVVEVDTSKLEEVSTVSDSTEEVQIEEVKEPIVYDGMTLNELSDKLNRSLKNELNGKGYLYASYSLEKGVDPYLAVAISLEETGCNWSCSNLVKSCNNVGGMKGSGCGSYGYFNTLDDGIRSFIDNIERNYVRYGLTTADTMNSKYAENPAWSVNVNNYIYRIKNN